MPLLLPQFRIVVVISGIAAVQNFVPILLLTGGGPNTATMVPGLDMYQSAFVSDLYGYGMAIATLLFIGMLVFTLVTIRLLNPDVVIGTRVTAKTKIMTKGKIVCATGKYVTSGCPVSRPWLTRGYLAVGVNNAQAAPPHYTIVADALPQRSDQY